MTEKDVLRGKAEKRLKSSPERLESMWPGEAQQALHELRVHQIELEMQNEELRRTQEELAASRARYFDLYDLAPVGYCTVSEKGLILEANLTAATLLGAARDSLVKQPLSRFVLKEDQDKYYLNHKRLLETGEPLEYELRLVKKDGTAFWAHLTAAFALDGNGEPACRVVLSDITERRRAEESLSESRREASFLAQLLDGSSQPFGVAYPDGRIGAVNRAFHELTGCSTEDLESPDWARDFTPPEGRERENSALAELARTGVPVRYEKEGLRKDGSRFPLEVLAHVVRDDDGRPKFYYSFFTDITERKKAEEALRAGETRFRSILETVALLGVMLDVEGNILLCNDYLLGLTGWSREEVLHRSWFELFIPEEIRAQIEDGVFRKTILSEDVPPHYRNAIVTRTGEQRLVDWSNTILRDEKGQVVGVASIGQDITERKKAEDALLKSEAKYRGLYEEMLDGFVLVNMDGRIQECNDAYCQMTGYSREELRERTYVDLTPERWHDMERRILDEQILGDGHSGLYDKEYRRKDGTLVPVELRSYLDRDENGSPVSIWAIVRDVSARKRAEEALLESERRYRTFIDATTDLVFLKDESFRYLISNPSNSAFLGKPTEAVVGCTDFDLMPIESAQYCRASDEEALARGEVVVGEEAVGQNIYQTVKFPVSLSGGKTGIGGYIRDITKRKRAEEALRESEGRFRFIVENAPGLVFYVHDRQNQFSYVSPSVEQVLGRPAAYFCSPHQSIWTDHPMNVQAQEISDRILRDGITPPPYLVESFHADGRKIILEAHERPFVKGGEVIGTLGLLLDITERKQVEEALRASERRFALFMQNLPGVAVIRDLEGRYVFMNEAWERAMGLRREDYIGKRPLDTFPPEDAQKLMEDDRLLIESGEDQVTEMELHHSSGPRWWLVNRFLMEEEGGRPASVATLYVDITDRKRAEKALLESETRFKSLVEGAPEAIVVSVRKDMKIAYANPAATNLYGASRPEELVSQSFLERVHPEWRATVLKHAARVDEGTHLGAPLEELHLRLDGSVVPVEVTVVPVTFDGQEGGLAFIRDISERKRVEEALRESEERFRSISEQINDLISLTDAEGFLTYASPSSSTLYGYSPDEMCGRKFMEFVDESEVPRATQAFLQVRDGGLPLRNLEFRMKRKDGSFFDGELNGSLFQFRGQCKVLVVIRDISERKRTVMALRKSEANLRTLVQTIPDLIWLKDSEGVYLSCNSMFERFFGAKEVDILGKTDYDFVDRELADAFRDHDRKAMAAGKPTCNEEWITFADGGHGVWLETIKTPMVDREGKLIGVLGIGRDITARKEAEAEILRLNAELKVHVKQRTSELVATTAELDGFSYSVSHDLRAPLRSIDGWSLALLEDYGDRLDDTARGYIQTVRAETKRMGQLVDGLLQISRATRREMTREPVDLGEIAKGISVGLARGAPERDVEFLISEGMTVEGDPPLLRVALHSLMENAWKFTSARDHAVIEFGVIEHEGVPAYFVRDNGVGFDPKFAHKLFQPFQRLHPKEEYPGSAIGLATVQRVIHRHGGEVWAEGEVDKGATFYFTLGGGSGDSEK